MDDTDENEEEDEVVEDVVENNILLGIDELDQKLSIHFREFDLSVANFVNLELELVECVPDTAEFASPPTIKIKPYLFHYVIADFNQKLAVILKSSGGSKIAGFGVQSTKPSKMQLFLAQNAIEPRDLAKHLSMLAEILLGISEQNIKFNFLRSKNLLKF